MARPERKSFTAPDERRTPPNTTIETVRFGDRTISRVTCRFDYISLATRVMFGSQ